MSTSVTFNGTSYQIPAASELNWQALSAFLIDVAQHAGLSTVETHALRVATTSPVSVSASADRTVITNLSVAGAVAVNLPAGVLGQIFAIVDGKGDAGTNNITVTPNGAETINGASSLVLAQNNQTVVLQFSATGWRVIESFYPALNNALSNPMTTANDIIVGGSGGSPARLATGAAGTVFKGGSSFAQIVDADVSSSAAIAGSKVVPSFGAQNIVTTGTLGAGTSTLGATTAASATVTGNFTPSGGYVGRTSSVAVASGYLGEVIFGTPTGGASGVANNSFATTTGVVSLSLTAGAWLIMAEMNSNIPAGTGVCLLEMSIETPYTATGGAFSTTNRTQTYTLTQFTQNSANVSAFNMTKNYVSYINTTTSFGLQARCSNVTGVQFFGRMFATRIA